MGKPAKILIVDDEPQNVMLLENFLSDDDLYDIMSAEDGSLAWDILEKSYGDIDLVLLDRMMPVMDGMELTRRMKESPDTKDIPIVMQTAATEKGQVVEGIEAGVYYYLTKPYDSEVLLSIVNAALNDYREVFALRGNVSDLEEELAGYKRCCHLSKICKWEISTLEHCREMSAFLSCHYPKPVSVVVGIMEILINALEHGNLGISYDEKGKLIDKRAWEKEIVKRQLLTEHKDKKILVELKRNAEEIKLTVTDEGEGFNWEKYMTIDPERVTHHHGRGIAMALMLSFDSIEYQGDGNIAIATVKI